jgi:SAM-dependent methyltransferase
MNTAHNITRWNRLAGRVQCTFPLEEVLARSQPNMKDSVLDYGCGDGRLLNILSRIGISNIWGCDASIRMCKLAQASNPGASVVRADFTREDPPFDPCFTLVIAVAVLSSIFPRSDRVQIMRTLQSLTAPGGRIVIADFATSRRQLYTDRYRQCKIESNTFLTQEGLYIHHFTLSELVRLVKMARFKVFHADSVPVLTLHGTRTSGHLVLGTRLP